MLRPPARAAALLLTAGLLLPALAACGDDGGGAQSSGGAESLSAVEVSGEPGSAIELEFSERMTVEETESEVLVEGDGATVEEGESALVHFAIANGYEQEASVNSYESGQPQLVSIGEQLIPGIRQAVEGHAVGSRVVVAATPADAFGESGNPELGIGNADPVLFVVDILSEVLQGPEGEEVDPQGPTPRLETEEGSVTALEFPPGYRATGELEVTYLVRGSGPEVSGDSVVAVDYLGQVLGKKKPFDESYSRQPVSFPLDGVVKGWKQGLTGVPVGSRVLLQIPPRLGYGKAGNPQAGIKGTDTLVFVVDVLGAS